ncbi:MAG: EF-P lysine aminoacylase GenX [Planctomycetaceae bacterium]|nr:EF-P lysine aminoacylase GenX [Planctomycetaceae bacterium]
MAGDSLPTASIGVLQQRARLLAAVRRYFDGLGYFEVETPLLSHDVCVDAWLDPFIVPDVAPGRIAPPMYLQTSPEFAMKRLLVAGAEAIYQVTRSFRRGESGRLHNPEFTIVEWYRIGTTVRQQMDLVEDLVRSMAALHSRPDATALDAQAFERLTYDDAFERYAGRRVLTATCEELSRLAARQGVSVPPQFEHADRDAWLNLLLANVVEPRLKEQRAVFLCDYPASQSALARVRADDPPVAERFELYLDGVEICNGYQELTDAEELAARMQRQATLRRAHGLSDLPTESRLIASMRAGLPECAGVALGFDRLAMWVLGITTIAEAVAFPFERA